jgi:PAS domain S-box-containing protein
VGTRKFAPGTRWFVTLSHQSVAVRYGFAIVIIVVATGARLALDPILGQGFPFFTLFLATLLAAFYGGLGPGLTAMVLGAVLGTRFLVPPRDSFAIDGFENQAGLVLYMLLGTGVSVLAGIMRDVRLRLSASLVEASDQREQLRTTLASIGDAVIATDADGRVTSLNAVAEQLTGWSLASALGRPLVDVFQIVNEETRRPVEDPVQRVLKTGTVVGLGNHTVLIARDGKERPIDDSAAPIRGADGTLHGVVLVFRDVTEARRAQAAKRHLAAIVEGSEDAIVSKDLNGIITSWNPSAQRMYGYAAEEIVGKPFSVLVPPGQADEVAEMARLLREGIPTDHFESVRRRKDCKPIDVSVSYSPIRADDGHLTGSAVIARDVSARKREDINTRFLAEASAVLAALTDEASTLQKVATTAVPHFADWCAVDMANEDASVRRVAVAHVDPQKVRLAHEIHRRWPPDPNSTGGVHHILRSGQPELAPDITDEMLEAGIKDKELLGILRELGLRSYIGVPLTIRGKILGVITFVTAESGRRYDTNDLAAAEELAHRAAVTLQNAHLYEAVVEADRRKDEFLATLAHELRNPLAPIRNTLYLLKTLGPSGANLDQGIEMMERQIHHLIRLVDDLLDVSRVMRGKFELRPADVNLATVARDACESAKPLFDSRSVSFAISLPDQPVWVRADAVRMGQVFSNLLTNAAKYTEPGGSVACAIETAGDQTIVRVRDNGVGIAPEMLAKIFDLFVQADTSTAKAHGGLGIGLTLVRSLVERHGGAVVAKSAGLGKGSEFVISLPLLSKPEGVIVRQDGPIHEPVPAPHRRILVVDDHTDAADSLVQLLRVEGHDVRIARSGSEAILAATSDPPEVILLDLGMPGMDGYEAARWIRTDPAARNTTIIAVTGWGQEEDRRRSREAGFNYHLVKPVDLDQLRDLLAH